MKTFNEYKKQTSEKSLNLKSEFLKQSKSSEDLLDSRTYMKGHYDFSRQLIMEDQIVEIKPGESQ